MKRPRSLSLSMRAPSKLQYLTYYVMAAVLLLSTTLFTLPISPVGAASSTTITLDADDTSTYGSGGIATNQDSYINDGSWKNDQSAYSFSNYMPIGSLGSFTVEDIADISFATKRLATDTTGYDYFVNIYTATDGVDDDSWYGRRITIDPIYSNDYNSASGDWVVWNSNAAGNTPTVYDSNNSSYGWYDGGSQTTAELSDLQSGPINWSDYHPGAPDKEIDYRGEEVLLISVATGGAWNGNFAGLVDDFNISLNNGSSVQVDFEGVDVTQSKFIGSPKYVRENNYTTDIAAQVEVPAAANEVRFEVNGETVTDASDSNETKDDDIYKVNGAHSGSQWWRLQKMLSGGEYTVTGEFKVDGSWYAINGSGTVYSIDSPTASYVLPNDSNHFFRAGDNPVRVKVEDEFNQFKRMRVEIDGSTHWVYRADCDLRQAGNYLLCDVDASSTWTALSEGDYTATTTTYTQVNNRVDNLVSREFTVDGTAPVVSRLEKVDPTGIVSDSMTIEADATDNNGVQNVEFFVRELRSDGACAPTESLALPSITDSTASDDTYSATFDTSALTGTYCVFAVAEDVAMHHSSPQAHKFSVEIDNTPPAMPTGLTIYEGHGLGGNELTCSGITNQTKITIDWDDNTETDLDYYWFGVDNQRNTNPKHRSTTNSHYYGNMTPDIGPYNYTVIAVDEAGNESEMAVCGEFNYDAEAPDVEVTAPSDGDFVSGTVDVRGTVQDDNPWRYYTVVRDGSTNVAGRGTVYDSSPFTDQPLFSWDTTAHADGEYTIRLEARDTAKNKDAGSTHVITVTVDNTAPLAAVDALTTTDTSPELTGTVNDPAATVEVEVEGNSYPAVNNGDGTWTLADDTIAPSLAVGNYTVTVTSTDTLGNSDTIEFVDYLTIEAVVVIPPVPESDTNNSQNSSNNNVPNNSGTNTASDAVVNSGNPNVVSFGSGGSPGNDTEGDVLGATTNENSEDSGDVAALNQVAQTDAIPQQENSDQENQGCFEIFGFCWYWWGTPVVLLVGWYALGTRREI